MSALAASAVTAGVTGLWWILGLGALAAGIIAGQSTAAETEEAESMGTETPYDLNRLDPALQASFRELMEQREQILTALEDLRDSPLVATGEVADRVNLLVDSYYDLLLKLKKIKPFISREAISGAKETIARLDAQIASCADDVTRDNLSMALRNKTDEMNRLVELGKYRKRIESQLVNVVSALNSLYLRIVHLSVTPGAGSDEVREVNDRINDLLLDMDISEKVTQEFQRIVQTQTRRAANEG